MRKLEISGSRLPRLQNDQKLWAYCGLDCLNVHPIYEEQGRIITADPCFSETHRLEQALLGPSMTMMRRGLLVDAAAVAAHLEGNPDARPDYPDEPISPLKRREIELAAWREQLGLYRRREMLGGLSRTPKGNWVITDKEALFPAISEALCGKPCSYKKNAEVAYLLYEILGLPQYYDHTKKTRAPSVKEEFLEKLAARYQKANFICRLVLLLRAMDKRIEVLEKKVDPDGRFRTSLAVMTTTGRYLSRSTVYGRGDNLQNKEKGIRNIFIADGGMEMGYVDLKTAESTATAYLAQDEAYIRACTEGDLHTTVAAMVFGIPEDKEYASSTYYYRHWTYRDFAKPAGHGTNYLLTPNSLANKMKIEQRVAWEFYLKYLGAEISRAEVRRRKIEYILELPHEVRGDMYLFIGAFDGIRQYHKWIEAELFRCGELTTPMGRRRHFLADPARPKTLRDATAFPSQSTVADILDSGLFLIWDQLEPRGLQILMQAHDAVLFQVPRRRRDEFEADIYRLMTIPVEVHGRTMIIPPDKIKWGANWRAVS